MGYSFRVGAGTCCHFLRPMAWRIQLERSGARHARNFAVTCRGLRAQARYGFDEREDMSDPAPSFPMSAGLSTPRQVRDYLRF